MMTNKIFLYLTVFICAIHAGAFGQRETFVRDTVYVLICRTGAGKEIPKVAYMLYKSLDSLPDLSTIDDRESAVCALLQSSIWFEEPVFTIGNYIQSYGFTSKKQQDSMLTELSRKISVLNSRYSVLHSKKFKGKDLQIECARIEGEFWIVDGQLHDINSLDHSIKVNIGCYSHSYWYNLKNIMVSQKISAKEVSRIQQKIGK